MYTEKEPTKQYTKSTFMALLHLYSTFRPMNKSETSLLYGKKDPYFTSAIQTASVLGGLFHTFMLAIFFFGEIWGLVWMNLFSVPLFALLTILIYRKRINPVLAYTFGSIEVVIHAVFGSYCIGIESNLMLLIWLIPFVFILSINYSNQIKITLGITCFILFIIPTLILKSHSPTYEISENFSTFFGLFSIGTFAFVSFLIMIYFSKIVKHKEEVILREIHHRVFNSSQISISISKLYIRNEKDSKLSNSLSEINDINQFVSSVHQLIYFNNDIGFVRTDRLFASSLKYDLSKQDGIKFEETHIPIDKATNFALIFHVLNSNFELILKSITQDKIVLESKVELTPITNVNHLEILEIFSEQVDSEVVFSKNTIEINLSHPIFEEV